MLTQGFPGGCWAFEGFRFEGFSGVGIQAYRVLELRIQCLGFGIRRVYEVEDSG